MGDTSFTLCAPPHFPGPHFQVHDMVKLQADTSTQGTQWGTGGMATKLTAARIAVAGGTTMVRAEV